MLIITDHSDLNLQLMTKEGCLTDVFQGLKGHSEVLCGVTM